MSVHQILTWPDKRLLDKALPVKDFDEEITSLCQDMIDTMRASIDGIGLAATQINVQKCVCVVAKHVVPTIDADKKFPEYVVLINPQVKRVGTSSFKWHEKCLSINEYTAEVTRDNDIILSYQDTEGKSHTKQITGAESATIQHELDHL